MGGNPLCAAAGVATMKLIADRGLVQRAAVKGDEVMQSVRDANIPCVKEVRGLGLMIGIVVDKPASEVFKTCMDRGLLICYAGQDVVRLAPPLIIDDALLGSGLEILADVLRA